MSGGAADLLGAGQSALRRAALLSAIGALLWLPQALFAARAIAALVGGNAPRLSDLAIFVLIGLLRILITDRSEAGAEHAALAALGRLRASLLAHESHRAAAAAPGQVASVVADQTEALRPYAARYLNARASMMALPPAILAASFLIGWVPGLILLIAGPTVPLFMALIGQAAGRASRAQLDQMGDMGALLADRAGALADIRLLGATSRLIDSFTESAAALRQRTMRVLRIAFISAGVIELFAALGVAIMAVFCGFSLLGQFDFGTWGRPLSAEQAVFLLLLAPEFFAPMREFAAVWHDRAAADALAGIVAGRQADRDAIAGQGVRAEPLPGPVLRLRGVRRHGIAYPDLDLAPGAALALTGISGAGKTTLLRLIAGLEQPDSGVITLDDQPLAEVADRWRAGLGWMPQHPHFLDATVARNLRMGRAGDLNAAIAAADAAGIVASLPQGLEARLGENGAGVSGGEARRLMLARALLGGPALILADEPTADLDAATAARIGAALMAAHAAGAGLILATHDEALAQRLPRRLHLGAAT